VVEVRRHCPYELGRPDAFFVETPLLLDDLPGHAELAAASPIRMAAGELNATRSEFIELMDVARVEIVHPDVPRAGGIRKPVRFAEAAWERGKLVVPHAWKTGITAAVAVHVSAVSPNCPFVEYLRPTILAGWLRKDLLAAEPVPVDGEIPPPIAPSLGVEVDPTAIEHYKVKDLVTQ
jgi:L-alanine-DL-glutamate epimerase-like enolase superfamily enzyme